MLTLFSIDKYQSLRQISGNYNITTTPQIPQKRQRWCAVWPEALCNHKGHHTTTSTILLALHTAHIHTHLSSAVGIIWL